MLRQSVQTARLAVADQGSVDRDPIGAVANVLSGNRIIVQGRVACHRGRGVDEEVLVAVGNGIRAVGQRSEFSTRLEVASERRRGVVDGSIHAVYADE